MLQNLQCNRFFEVLRVGTMTAVVAHIDEQTVKDAEAVLRPMGFTASDVVRLLIVRIAKDKALPFEPFEPNAETIEAMEAARRGEVVKVGDIDGLFASLHADD
jgi:DNA-damage-inducible protein J